MAALFTHGYFRVALGGIVADAGVGFMSWASGAGADVTASVSWAGMGSGPPAGSSPGLYWCYCCARDSPAPTSISQRRGLTYNE